ncbi:hypothetical protein ACHAWF_002705 [Thalassiosira exigua]
MANPTTASARRRRAYVGNLRPRPDLPQNLYRDLFVPHCLTVRNFPVGDGIIVRAAAHRGSGSRSSSAYALVEFSDVDYAIQMLDGVQFDGRTLRVSREKTNFGGTGMGGRKGGGFGSSHWAGNDGGGESARRSKVRTQRQRENESSASAKSRDGVPPSGVSAENNNNTVISPLNEDEIIAKEIGSVVATEIEESSDEVTAAIASTAAMTLLSSVDAFGLDYEQGPIETPTISSNLNEPFDANSGMTNQNFQSRCQMPLSDLLAEYGEQDMNWKKQQPKEHNPDLSSEKDNSEDDFQSRRNMPLSDLLAEYGDQDVDWKKDQDVKSKVSKKRTPNSKKGSGPVNKEQHNDKGKDNNGMLAAFGKASIHVELVSFGYKYGAPSHSRKGFTYAHPLPPIDVRDLDRAPGNVAKFNGLSYLVKRALLNPSNDDETDLCDEKKEGGNNGATKEQAPMRIRANDVADETIKALVESIDEGGHGPISPLTMTISIGSEYGRHRAVVLVEHLAVVLRARLRRNDGRCFESAGRDNPGAEGQNGIVKQPVSVGTRHRDVEARHQDEEAFGEDLKREARKAESAKRRHMDDSGWDYGSW